MSSLSLIAEDPQGGQPAEAGRASPIKLSKQIKL